MSPVVLALVIFAVVLTAILWAVAVWLDLGARRDENQS